MSALAEHAWVEQMLISWKTNADNEGAQRFYRQLGATLHTKVIATWLPADYAAFV